MSTPAGLMEEPEECSLHKEKSITYAADAAISATRSRTDSSPSAAGPPSAGLAQEEKHSSKRGEGKRTDILCLKMKRYSLIED